MIRLIIVDDHALARSRLRALLGRVDDIEIIGEAQDGQEAVDLTEKLAPDVVLMDIRMPNVNGLAATKRICSRAAHSRVLIVAMSWDSPIVRQAMDNGASGYVAKHEAPTELIHAIRAVYKGDKYISPFISDMLARDGVLDA